EDGIRDRNVTGVQTCALPISAKDKELDLKEISDFESITGKGIQGKIDGKTINVVSPGFVKEREFSFDQATFEDLSAQGKTVVFLLVDNVLAGMIALADIVRDRKSTRLNSSHVSISYAVFC